MPQLDDALANILHLLELPDRPSVGQFGMGGMVLTSILRPVVGKVLDLEHAPPPASMRNLDLVVQFEHLHESAAQMVRPGGWLVVYREYRGRWAQAHSFPPDRVAEVRRWLVSPGLHFPYAVVPQTRVAMRAHQLATRAPGWKRTVRLAAIELGWPAREFTGEVVAVRLS